MKRNHHLFVDELEPSESELEQSTQSDSGDGDDEVDSKKKKNRKPNKKRRIRKPKLAALGDQQSTGEADPEPCVVLETDGHGDGEVDPSYLDDMVRWTSTEDEDIRWMKQVDIAIECEYQEVQMEEWQGNQPEPETEPQSPPTNQVPAYK